MENSCRSHENMQTVVERTEVHEAKKEASGVSMAKQHAKPGPQDHRVPKP